ncbi:acetyl-CoA carboxylase biotin carboxylase subunit [Rhodococcus qingshengii]|uniref:acetyl-CoA carboxylase biotin carboxylase subunit n=1 Tax=Rhodococcus qingshengii TaxID=334542 RepID=UPI001C2170CC|nr:biotin carboxylase N-terminal domain-containing protein [Rhodococcus qingshengii]QXC46287.1 ATP-grasp domain-containing protein [Rhodococcus qingshengii]
MFESLLVANRGEIAVRVLRTARKLGIRTVAVYSEADKDALHVHEADEAVLIGPAPIQQSYLNVEAVLRAARERGVSAVHPGYGLLSERADFARSVQDNGLTWVGPSPDIIEMMGDKIKARVLMSEHGVPVAGGTSRPPQTVEEAVAAAARIGYPVMIKAAGGGGGIGMSAVDTADALVLAFEAACARAQRLFGSSDILLEQFIQPARHIEVQILGLNDGRILALGERDCSVQRRFQKVVEETPATAITDQTRERMLAIAVRAGESIDYRGVGTVEFLLDVNSEQFMFLEMNTRLQVEHPITELVTGLDLVELQLRVAAGEQLDLRSPASEGHAIEFRLYAEDPVRFLPTPGPIETWNVPSYPWLRIDTGYHSGMRVSHYYDPLIAKICVHGVDRNQALARARTALNQVEIGPVTTNLSMLRRVVTHTEFENGMYDTGLLDHLK